MILIIIQIIFIAFIIFKIWMKIIRLMEIKEEKLDLEKKRLLYAHNSFIKLKEILKVLKNGNYKRKSKKVLP